MTTPTVVLLHSLATSRAIWAAQAAVWSSRFEVIALDLPGHGDAPARALGSFAEYATALREILDERGVARAAIVGLSLGGMVAQAFALAYPERTRALVLAHTAARTPPEAVAVWTERLATVNAGGVETQVAPTLARWFTPEFAAAAPHTVAWIAGLIRRTSVAGFLTAGHAIQRLDHVERLAALRAPTLVLTGARDPSISPDAARRLAAAIPGARFAMIDSAHLGNIEQPVAFTEHVAGFLEDVLR